MIGSFWNLCRACPSMPVDKQLHSEYRSTYRWHEFTGNPRPDVVRRAPQPNPNQFVGPTNEPPLPRRKKCPELAYKSHEFIIGSEYTDSRSNITANRIARSEERGGTPSRRSKSEGPPAVPNGRAYPIPTEIDGVSTKQAGESNGLFKKTITKLSTEYRLQFVWPHVRKSKVGQKSNVAADAVDQPKKSLSMGAIIKAQQAQQQQTMMPTVHKKRTTNQKEATLHELEPLVSDTEERKPHEKQVTIVEKKSAPSMRPFSQLIDLERNNHFITRKENFGFDEQRAKYEMDNKQQTALLNGSAPPHSQPNLDLWFKEVVELRKKAGEYKCRGWGMEIDPELYKKQKDLWDQVSKNSSLSALSLASSIHRPITKEEKEQENNKKSIPLKSTATQKPRVPGQAYLIDNRVDEMTALPARFANIRHHLERTTGPDVEEGALLPSPTREKLMPAITKRESESQRGSPKKTAASRHGSPQKGSPQKGSPKKTLKSRSQSVGPGYIENESPKRQIRSASTAPAAKLISGKKTPTSAIAPTTTAAGTTGIGAVGHVSERKPRPSTLSTTFHSRTKSSSLPPNGRAHSVRGTNVLLLHPTQSQSSNKSNEINHQQTKMSPQPHAIQMHKKDKDKENICTLSGMGKVRPKTFSTTAKSATSHTNTNDICSKFSGAQTVVLNGEQRNAIKHLAVPGQDKKLVEHDGEDGRETAISISSCSPQLVPEIPDEPIVKSPPEPTRVKSPEQIIMRSPDPVNWTVPLDTGKTFTVTQNVKEGESYSRPQSEIKASTPVEKPPPPPQSAPPELTEQVKMDAWKYGDHSNITNRKSLTASSPTSAMPGKVNTAITAQPLPGQQAQMRYEAKPIPGSTLRCLDDPSMNFIEDPSIAVGGSSSSPSTSTATVSTAHRTTATDVLEKARDRFDRFWGGNKEDSV